MPRTLPILLLLIPTARAAAAQDGLAARNEAFLRAVLSGKRDSVATFFPSRGEWTWVQTNEGAPPEHRVSVRRFAATETLRAISRGGPACGSFWPPSGGVGPVETVLSMRIGRNDTPWHRVGGNRFVPRGESARSPAFVQWRREDGRWVVDSFGDAAYWSPRVLGAFRGGDVVRDTVLRLPPTPVYAAAATWYVNNQPITFEGFRYIKLGMPRPLGDSLLARIGRFGLVGVYAAKTDAYAEVLYIPVAPGEYQPYAASHGRRFECN